MKKKNGNNDFKNMINEKQNSLASGIRIGYDGSFPVVKQQFVKIKEVEYSTDFEFFLTNQVQVIVGKNNNCSICSSLERRVFQDNVSFTEDALIFELIQTIHRDIITFKYDGDLVY